MNRSLTVIICWLLKTAILVLSPTAGLQAAGSQFVPPNIVYILADDK
ncbi:hypothetical protein ETAA8_22470 [Anatilimnocola aggregata]|uniref:Uncharacterized protein n=1 Tax=Anatilimnocola aggregata TaxID=2528021 RepID=A0A517YAI1_9BACT|nr:hypothetical protein [Anatilimnocola aggregata]QDU27162.1 hypothetical protein ETAA8_22470 [Anatilimnocola aggregata]